MGIIPSGTKLHNNFGQVVHTYVPLSPSSITWYWSKDGDVSSTRKVTAGLAESNGSLLPVDNLVICGLTACTPGSAAGPMLGNKYGRTLPFLLHIVHDTVLHTNKHRVLLINLQSTNTQ